MESMVLISTSDLRALIRDEVRAAQPVTSSDNKKKKLNVEEALTLLNDHGYPLSKSYLYVLCSRKEIPFKKFGRESVFDRDQILNWAEDRAKDPSIKNDAIRRIGQAAKRAALITK